MNGKKEKIQSWSKYMDTSGVSSMELRVLEHPPQLWHNSQLSTSVTNAIVNDNRWLAAPINN